MADLDRLGIRLEAHGDRLGYFPRSAVTPDLARGMKARKPELLAALRGDDEPKFVIPLMNPDELGPEGWPIDAVPWSVSWDPVTGSVTARKSPEIAPGACDRCGAMEYRDVPIHGGRSTRRDCAQCGRFRSWPTWSSRSDGPL